MPPNPLLIQVECVSVPSLEALSRRWIDLGSRSSSSFFNSWTWIGPWLDLLPARVERRLLQATSAGRIVGLAVLCRKTVRRARIVPSRTLFIHCTGEPELDELTVEHNQHLAEIGLEQAVAQAFADYLLQRNDWDELSFPGWSGELWVKPGTSLKLREGTDRSRPCRYVELGRIRLEGVEYLDRLSGTVRHKIRRAIREAERHGMIRIDVADSANEALEFLARLEELHQKSWGTRGEPGSFSNPHFKRFHESLVRRETLTGKVQLLRLSVGQHGVGYLYNMIHGGHVLQYQSGFDYEYSESTSWRPGMVCHTLAISHYLSMGMETYDFLAGDQRYKRELSTAVGELTWTTLQRPRLRFHLERCLRMTSGVLRPASPSTTAD